MNRLAECPQPDQLGAYLMGRLPGEFLDLIAEHVEQCAGCEAQLNDLDLDTDRWLQCLQSPQREELPEDDELGQLISRADQLRPQPEDGTKHERSEAELPRTFGQYELVEQLGRGGMGTVYKARQTRLNRWVAIKLISADRLGDVNANVRFRREMEAVGMFDHPNIIRAHDAGEIDGQYYLATELIFGLDLDQLVKRRGPLPVAESCHLVGLAASAIHHAHLAGLLHRDIKPSNLMLSEDGELKILDLGLVGSTRTDDEGDLSREWLMLGTADYVAPEQGLDARQATARSDVYSLGCVLFYLLVGRPPYGDDASSTQPEKSFAHKVLDHLQQPLPDLATRRSDVPRPLAKLVQRTLSKRLEQRPPSAAALSDGLALFAHGAQLARLAASQGETSQHGESARGNDSLKARVRVAAKVLIALSLLAVILVPIFWPAEKPLSADAQNDGPEQTDLKTQSAAKTNPQIAKNEHAEKTARTDRAKPLEDDTKKMQPLPSGFYYWDPADGGNGHFYQRVKKTSPWTDAKVLAEQSRFRGLKGHLVTISSPSENQFVANRVLGFSPAWIGLTDSPEYGGQESRALKDPKLDGWTWITGDRVRDHNYSCWGPGRPQNANDRDKFVFMYSGGLWDDGDDFGLPYLVEYE